MLSVRHLEYLGVYRYVLLAIICTVLMVSPGKGLSIGSRVKSFFGVLFMYILVIFNEFDIKLLLTYAFADSASAILSDPESRSRLGSIFTDVFSIILLSVYILYIYFSYYKKNMRTKLRKLDKLILAGYLVLLMFVGGIFAAFEQENISIAGGNESLKSIVTLLVSVIVIAAPFIMMRVRASAYYKALHGCGIGNIRRTVEKYGGMMRLSCAERVFTVEIILSK